MDATAAPLLPLRRLDNIERRRHHLPRRDTSLAAFLVKVSDVLVNGMFTVNVLATTYFLGWGNPDPKVVLKLCTVSQIGWKAVIFGLPLALYPFTLWISGVARSAEVDLRGLSTVSVWVFMEISWCILVGAFLSHCVSGANYIMVFLVAGFIIVLLMAIWGFTFNRPACFRWCCCNCCYCSWCCCCCLPPEIAAAEANDQVIVSEELARQVARAQVALAAQVMFQEEASAAKEREVEADNVHKKATEDAEKSWKLAQDALNAVEAAKSELTAKDEAKEDTARIKREKQDLATAARTRARNAADAPSGENNDAIAAETELQEAIQADSAAEEDILAARRRVSETTTASQAAEDALTIANRKADDAQENRVAAKLAAKLAAKMAIDMEECEAARLVYEQLQAVRAIAQV